MHERIKLLRKTLKLTLENFAGTIGVSKSAVSMIEKGTNTPGEQTIMLIADRFNVNELWLREGVGEMFDIARARNADERKFLEIYRELTPGMQAVVFSQIKAMVVAESKVKSVPDEGDKN